MSSLLNAIDMRLNLAEIVVTGEGAAADALVNAALALPYVNRAVLRAPSAEALPALASGAGEGQGGARAGCLRLRRRDLLAAGDKS